MNIYESIAAVQADVDCIGKDKQTQGGAKFKYRGVDQVLNTLHPLFAKHKVFAVPEVLELLRREERTTSGGGAMLYQVLKIKYTFYAEDGSNVSAVVVGEAMDNGDKVSNKCMSVAYKYACFQLLSIPTEETTADPDDTNEALAPKKQTPEEPSGEQKPPKTSQKKTKFAQVNDLIKDTNIEFQQITDWIVSKYGPNVKINDLTDEQFELLMRKIKTTLGVADEQ